jgi:ParB family chromosome partitioning protein
LNVASTIPSEIIHAIGPAPKVGRPRWVQLADLLKAAPARKKAAATIAEPAFRGAETNTRFSLVVQSLAMAPQKASPQRKLVRGASGHVLARIEETPRHMRLSLEKPEFRAFVLSRLPSLVEEFEQGEPSGEGQPNPPATSFNQSR